ncbi:hypothetical protein VTP01DRAFT_7200 [Rhizomucor pusillus]|uniref:uncharacterized protein n=1 Tax=Rhizomucor pusillus TaxID=4840 RepID=UPI003743941E
MCDMNWCTFCDNAVSAYSNSLYCSEECLRADALNHHPLLGYDYAELRDFPRPSSPALTYTSSSSSSSPTLSSTTPSSALSPALSSASSSPSSSSTTFHLNRSHRLLSPPAFDLNDASSYNSKPRLSAKLHKFFI